MPPESAFSRQLSAEKTMLGYAEPKPELKADG
jgi:hypothetical protein